MNSSDLSRRPYLASHVRLKIDPITGDPILLFPEGMLMLNSTAHEVVRRCDGRTSIEQMAEQLAEEFDAAKETLLPDLLQTIEELSQRNLLRFAE
jgi:pyrroloquinoline quinone biosynthesis protein D